MRTQIKKNDFLKQNKNTNINLGHIWNQTVEKILFFLINPPVGSWGKQKIGLKEANLQIVYPLFRFMDLMCW